MTQPMPNKCPLCSGALEVTGTRCLECEVEMHGHFALAPYRNLDAEQIRFLETFLRCRGVIRDMEAALGISYPTVRARLDALLSALGFDSGPYAEAAPANPPMTAAQKAAQRKEILTAIENGTLDADAGLNALQALSAETK
jgi:hypothetical protein